MHLYLLNSLLLPYAAIILNMKPMTLKVHSKLLVERLRLPIIIGLYYDKKDGYRQ